MLKASFQRHAVRAAVHVSLIGAVLLVLHPAAAAGQSRVIRPAPVLDSAKLAHSREVAARQSTVVTIVFVDSTFQSGVLATVWRRAKRQPQNVILIPLATRDGTILSGALAMLSSSRRAIGDELTLDVKINVAQVELPDDAAAMQRQAAGARRLALMFNNEARLRRVDGLGMVRAVTLPVMPVRALASGGQAKQ